jgi:hypothetical protein
MTCLQETTNYNVCCQWTRTEECDVVRKDIQDEQETAKRALMQEKQAVVDPAFANRTKQNATRNSRRRRIY